MSGMCQSVCGNNILEAGEGCDDGDTDAGDGCNAACKVEDMSACNGGMIGEVGNSSCDSGICDMTGNPSPGICEPMNTCGNSVLESGEGCDDGNTTAGDGCNAMCLLESGKSCTASSQCESMVCTGTPSTCT